MIYFESEYAEISWDENLKCVVGRWKKFATGKNFQEPLEKGLELLQKKKTSKWLADTRKVGVISRKDQEWHDQNWVPRFILGGARFVATIVPEDIVAKMSLDAISTAKNVTKSPLTVKNFSSVEEAKTWLERQK